MLKRCVGVILSLALVCGAPGQASYQVLAASLKQGPAPTRGSAPAAPVKLQALGSPLSAAPRLSPGTESLSANLSSEIAGDAPGASRPEALLLSRAEQTSSAAAPVTPLVGEATQGANRPVWKRFSSALGRLNARAGLWRGDANRWKQAFDNQPSRSDSALTALDASQRPSAQSRQTALLPAPRGPPAAASSVSAAVPAPWTMAGFAARHPRASRWATGAAVFLLASAALTGTALALDGDSAGQAPQAATALAEFRDSLWHFAKIALPVGFIFTALRAKNDDEPIIPLPSRVQFIAEIALTVAVLGYAFHWASHPNLLQDLHALGLWAKLKTAFLIGAADLGLSFLLTGFLPSRMSDESGPDFEEMGFWALTGTLLFAAAYEELLSRVLLFGLGYLALNLILPAAAAFVISSILSSAVFAKIHDYGDFNPRFFAGLVYAAVFYFTGSFWLATLVHFFDNWIILGIVRLYHLLFGSD